MAGSTSIRKGANDALSKRIGSSPSVSMCLSSPLMKGESNERLWSILNRLFTYTSSFNIDVSGTGNDTGAALSSMLTDTSKTSSSPYAVTVIIGL